LPSAAAVSVNVAAITPAVADFDTLPTDVSYGSEMLHSPSPSFSSPTLAPASMSHSHVEDKHSEGGCLVSPNAHSLLSSFDEFVDSSLLLPRRPSAASPKISCTSEELLFPLGVGDPSVDAKQVSLPLAPIRTLASPESATASFDCAGGTSTATSTASAVPSTSKKSHKKQHSGLDGHSSSGSDWSQRLAVERRPATNQYLVLEDLTSQYKQPCVLDLKLGTRQHGLNETAAKIKSKTNKVKNSTSSSLGLRVCGMQVFHPGDQEFLFRDKYFGRSIDAGAFEENLLDFLYNGSADVADASSNAEPSSKTRKRRGFFREDLVPLLVERLEAFKKVVGLQTQYRFYSSSLLLLYEGAVPADYDPCTILPHFCLRAMR
jgi:hypothetical protein